MLFCKVDYSCVYAGDITRHTGVSPKFTSRVNQMKADLRDVLAFPAGHNDCILSRELKSAVFPV